MKLISNENIPIANIQFDSRTLNPDCQEVLNHSLFVPFDYDSTPHSDYQELYRYIAQQEGWGKNMDYGLDTEYVGFFIPFNKDGIMDFESILCYTFGSYPTYEILLRSEDWLNHFENLKIKVIFEAGELLELAASFVKQKRAV